MNLNYIIVPIFLLLCCNLIGAVHECYYCSTLNNGVKCNDPFKNSTTQYCYPKYKPTNASYICVKFSYQRANKTITERGCRTSNTTCSEIQHSVQLHGDKFVGCNTCTKDLCNLSTTLVSVPLFSVSMLSIIYLIV